MNVPERLLQLEEKIDRALRRSGRDRNEVKLMAVTKTHPLETVEAAWKAGLKLFGESKVQEAAAKFPEFLEKHLK
ncbi:MAG: YggS family pyridoxal phosphate-dependent enzyme, partial [Treponema sp.]|nr:YggS family pyridoxal phosphate-dependent enzyme [Treponema sp.]